MGVDWYAKAAIGCKVEKASLYVTRRERVCNHVLSNPAAMAYCPTCGKPAWQERQRPIDGFDDGEETGRAMLHGFPVARGTNGTCFVVCLKGCFAEADDGQGADGAFGLWAVLYCSY
jgi:hypothetical protein